LRAGDPDDGGGALKMPMEFLVWTGPDPRICTRRDAQLDDEHGGANDVGRLVEQYELLRGGDFLTPSQPRAWQGH